MRVVRTTAAPGDVEGIQDHVARDDPAAAYRLAGDLLDRTTELLAGDPMTGRVGRVAGTRELVVSGTRYVVAYRVRDRVEVLAVGTAPAGGRRASGAIDPRGRRRPTPSPRPS